MQRNIKPSKTHQVLEFVKNAYIYINFTEQFGKVHKIWAQLSGLHFMQAVQRDTESYLLASKRVHVKQNQKAGWSSVMSSYAGKICAKQPCFPALLQL